MNVKLFTQVGVLFFAFYHSITSSVDIKPSNLILKPTDTDVIVRYNLAEYPCTKYQFENPISPFEVPFNAFKSAPLAPSWLCSDDLETMGTYVWVIADFSDCRWSRIFRCSKFY